MRTHDEIKQAENEMFDRVWYHRSFARAEREGKEPQVAVAPMREVEAKYAKNTLTRLSEFQLGMLHGKLSALRWVMGSEWDSLDT
jgi:hypothetical protein